MTPEEKNERRYLPRLVLGGLALLALVFLGTLVLPQLRRIEQTLVSPIEVTGVPEGYVVVRQSKTQAKIRLTGSPADLNRSDLFRLQVNLPEHPDMDGAYPLVASLSSPSAIQILEITPPNIEIHLAKMARRNVPVRVRLEGEPAPGFRLGAITVVPALTLVSGPLETVQKIKVIETTPLSVTGATAPIKRVVSAEKPNQTSLTYAPELFTVLIQVEEIPTTLRLKGVPVTPGLNEPREVSVIPETVDIDVTGPSRLVEALRTGQGVTAVIDTQSLKTGIFVRRAAITLPEGVNLIGATPELFTVTIPPSS
ncbi:CdaR family protein [Desulfoluna sp.]|uniref:CdaR family protein n=1 Tax=Desulfoluna sp. TaxID=2045199 RepID=UPI0026352F75|nr:CdaR family protein [Desulfoluna sp.]